MANNVINKLTGATSGKEYKIKGYSSMPSFGPIAGFSRGYSNLFEGYDGQEFKYQYDTHGKYFPEGHFAGVGLYIDYSEQQYYWYVASRYVIASYTNYEHFSIDFYSFSGEKKQPTSKPYVCYFDGSQYDCFEATGVTEVGRWDFPSSGFFLTDEYGMKEFINGVRPESDVLLGSSLGFWLFDSGTEWTCFMEGTKIAMADGTTKNIEDVQVHDEVAYLNDNGELLSTKVVLPVNIHEGETDNYVEYIFSNGTSLNIYEKQRLWNEDEKKYTIVQNWPIGTRTKTVQGEIISLVNKISHKLETPKKHYFLQTFSGVYAVNDILTYTSQDTIWDEWSREENKQYWLDEKTMQNQKKKVITRRYENHPNLYKYFRDALNNWNSLQSELSDRILANKKYLNDTDYLVIKYTEGLIDEASYETERVKRADARSQINEDQETLTKEQSYIDALKNKYALKSTHPRASSQGAESLVLMADGTTKAIKDVEAGDVICYLNDNHELAQTQVMLPPEPELIWDYHLVSLDNGTELRMSGKREIYNVSQDKYCYQQDCLIGDEILLSDGSKAKILKVTKVRPKNGEEFYRLNTRSGRYILNGISIGGDSKRNYKDMLWEEHEYWRPSDEFMSEWKAECGL